MGQLVSWRIPYFVSFAAKNSQSAMRQMAVVQRRIWHPRKRTLVAANSNAHGEQVKRAALYLPFADVFQKVQIDGTRVMRYVDDEG